MKRIFNILLAFIFVINSQSLDQTLAQTAESAKNGSADSAAAGSSRKADSSLTLTLPLRENSVRFLAIGDTGRGNREQHELARVMVEYRRLFPYEFVIMTGDNIYGKQTAEDLKLKFEDVYKTLLDQDVKFYASLGNHDDSNQRFYKYFNMNGQEYYRIQKRDVSFYALNSVYLDERQLKWMEKEFAKDTAKWKIAFFHHPPYSSGKRHGSAEEIRKIVEPIFIKHGVDVVFTGHDHFYERIKPQKGIHYFVTGAGGKIRSGDIKKKSPLTESGFDRDLSFMLIEISEDEMHFQSISRTGATVDSGVIRRPD